MGGQARSGYVRVDESQTAVLVRAGDMVNGKEVVKVEMPEPVVRGEDEKPTALRTTLILKGGKKIYIDHTNINRKTKNAISI